MRRLRDQIDSRDPETAREARLLQAHGPLPQSWARMQRVRAALDNPRQRWWQGVLRHPLSLAAACGLAVFIVGRSYQLVEARRDERAAALEPACRAGAPATGSASEPSVAGASIRRSEGGAVRLQPGSDRLGSAPSAIGSTS